MKKFGVLATASILSLGVLPALATISAASASTGISCNGSSGPNPPGFNACGYNYTARVFSGLADGVDKNLDGTIYGDPTYANDHLVMKWNAQWDNCNANGYDSVTYCLGAWVTNEWNGMLPNGSSYTEHVKVIWVGSLAEASPYWVPGGYLIWSNYEAIQDQGMVPGPNGQPTHTVWAAARPNGLG